MQVSTFQALCLLPDGEKFVAFRPYWRGEKQTWHRFEMSVEEVSKLAEASYTSRLCQKRGIGYVLPFGNIYLKMDRSRFLAFLDDNGLEVERTPAGRPKIRRVASRAASVPDDSSPSEN